MQHVSAWISSQTLQALHSEADHLYPCETGGVLIGYWADDRTVVISAGVGPGPAAIHKRYSYEHDHVWEAAQIARYYEKSRRSQVYIGDWHTHPDAASGALSPTDRRSIRRVIKSREARASRPLMTVFFGRPGNWESAIWVSQFDRRSAWPWPPRLLIEAAQIRPFD